MDASGPIFAVLVVACLFYLVPRGLSWRIPTQKQVDQQTPLHLSMKTVHSGVPVQDQASTTEEAAGAASGQAGVSTILMRRAGRRTALRLARQAEKRRQVVFIVLCGITVASVPFAVLGWRVHWWVPLAGLGVVLAWVAFSQIESRRVQKQLDAIVADIELGDDEKTVAVQLIPGVQADDADPADTSDITGPNGDVQTSLWDPITVVPATYMSAPTSARTVRTIDLGAPTPAVPVTDDWRSEDTGEDQAAV